MTLAVVAHRKARKRETTTVPGVLDVALPAPPSAPVRRRGKELRERIVGVVGLLLTSPVFGACAAAIKIEGLVDPEASGPVFFREARIARGHVIKMLKFRTLTRSALDSLDSGPTHIAHLERAGELTRVGRFLKQWYLDELPQLVNIARGEIGLIGTRPYPIELYVEEVAEGIDRKRVMPAGLIGPVQSRKGDPAFNDGISLDERYWEMFQSASAWALFKEDVRIVLRSARVQLEHKGI